MRNSKRIYLLALLPFLVVVLLYEILPLFMMIFSSFMPENAVGFTLEHYKTIFTTPLYQRAIINSIRISLVSSLIGIVIAFFGAQAIHNSSTKLQTFFLTILNMTSNFAGVPLAFAYMIILGNSGVIIQFARQYGLLTNFDLYTSTGLTMIYVYFQIPLSTLLLVPAFEGIRKEWKESSLLLGASPMHFWTKIGIPVLMPSILGTISVLFANALAAYATAYALLMNNFALLPISVSGMFTGDMVQRKELGSALSVLMMVLMVIAIAINNAIIKKTRKAGA